MRNFLNGVNLPLRSKIVITQTFISLLLVIILLFISTNMVFEDKKAYLYDSVFSNVKTSNQLLERYFSAKVLNSKAQFNTTPDKTGLNLDKDLYQVKILQNDKLIELYRNTSHEEKYRKNRSFLEQEENMLLNLSYKAKESGEIKEIAFKKGKMPFLNIAIYSESERTTLLYSYVLDSIFEEIFSKKGYENALIKTSGEIVYKNVPYLYEDLEMSFYLKFFNQIQALKKGAQKLGLKESKKSNGNYMIAYKQLNSFPSYYILSEVNNKTAYRVTTTLALKTFSYAVILIGIFNIISLFLSKSITNPLNNLLEGIRKISAGDYEAKIDIKTKDEFKQLGDSFNEMGEKIVEYNEKLKEYNRTLEDKVNERTADLNSANEFINTMINSLDQGLLVFNQLGKCQDTFTKPCEDFFQTSPKGKRVKDLIKPEDENTFAEWMKNLFEEPIPFKSIVELGPKFIPTEKGPKDMDFKHITLNYYPMRDSKEKVANVVLVATDKTKEYLANEKVKEQNNYINFLSSVLSNRKEFDGLVDFFNNKFNEIKNEPPRDWTEKENKDELLMLLHSLKGGFSLFKMIDLTDEIHDYETYAGKNDIQHDQLLEQLEAFNTIIINNIEKLEALIGQNEDDIESVELSLAAVEHFQKALTARGYGQVSKQFKTLFAKLPVKSYVNSYVKMINELAPKLGKEIKTVSITGGDLLVDKDYYKDFFASCVHVFRNGIDHGIETPDVRKESNKEPGGSIDIKFEFIKSKNNSKLKFSVIDDGGGINPDKLKEKMKSIGYEESTLNKDDNELIYHIFDMELSTAEQITDLSGRGVGLSDVKKRAEELGGEVNLVSEIKKGTTFEFLLPYR